MKRRALFILLLLVALVGGAIVNVAVAWGIALRLPVIPRVPHMGYDDSSSDVSTCLAMGWGRVYVIQAWGYGTMASNGRAILMDRQSFMKALPYGLTIASGETVLERSARTGTIRLSTVNERAVGWPLLALSEVWFFDQRRTGQSEEMQGSLQRPGWLKLIAVPSNEVIRWQLPSRPIWPGFAINTVFYAFILWLLFALGGTPFALRKRRRIKRGLCPKCAYPVGTSDVCTECGAAVVLAEQA